MKTFHGKRQNILLFVICAISLAKAVFSAMTTVTAAPSKHFRNDSNRGVIFSRDASNVRSNNRHVQLFAVRGHGKSGTNWVRNLLNLHPEIHCVGEMNIEEEPVFRSLFQESTKKNFPSMKIIKPNQWFFQKYSKASEEGGKDVYARLVIQATEEMSYTHSKNITQTTRLGEHSPQKVGFPFIKDMPTIYIVRDGRDVVVSWAFHLLNICVKYEEECDLFSWVKNKPNIVARLRSKLKIHKEQPQYFTENPMKLFTSDENGDDSLWVSDLAESWQHFCESHKTFYNNKNPEDKFQSSIFLNDDANVFTIFYEQLHQKTKVEADALYDYLGVNPKLADEPSVATRTLPGKFKNKGNKFYRKGASGAWRDYATETFIKAFKNVAQNGLEYYGYEKNSDW